MSNSDDGGSAFPVPHPNAGAFGMSLRDWFAGQALAGMCSLRDLSHDWGGRLEAQAEAVKTSYVLADAMLAEREKASK